MRTRAKLYRFSSGIWQALWTYGFGPVILFKIRNIQDTHRWKLQTTLAILFSLPALPLWLFTWFIEDFYVVNWYWPPTLWFVPGLAAMEFVILAFPIIELYEYKSRLRKAKAVQIESQFSKYSIAALEMALRDDIERLEEFAATKDFSGENIIFLKRVENWKDRWIFLEANSPGGQLTPNALRDLYDAAKQIFHDCICPDTSPFPINVDECVFLRLERVLGTPKPPSSKPATRSIIAPFADDVVTRDWERRAEDSVFFRAMLGGGTPTRRLDPEDIERPPTPPRKNSVPLVTQKYGIDPLAQKLAASNPAAAAILFGERLKPIPRGFAKGLFDESEREIKQIVLENTWVRYVDSEPMSEMGSLLDEKNRLILDREPKSLMERWKDEFEYYRTRTWRWRRR